MKKVFLYIILLVSFSVIFSCSNKITPTNNTTQTVIKEGFIKGEIINEYEKDGCKYLIKAEKDGKELIYAAINLDESLKQNGKQFQFTFIPTKAPRKGNCKRGIYIYIKEYMPL